VQREAERNRSNIDTEIMALVDAALEHLARRLPHRTSIRKRQTDRCRAPQAGRA
jgi:hypothetical protein